MKKTSHYSADLKEKILRLAGEIYPQLVEYRRHLHAHPELSFQEHQTAAFIAGRLTDMGIACRTGVAKTGIVATIEGINPYADLIALRADMDALPISEQSDVKYASMHPGAMHACGHDAHMASLLGTAYILHRLCNEFNGSVRVIFQPSEESLPGGAKMMIDEGVLDNPRPRCIFGQHVYSQLNTGQVGFRKGPSMASSDEIYIRVIGKGGHGATPHLVVDPIVVGAQLVTSLQQVVSRHAPPHVPSVLSFGRFNANGRMNIIPDEAQLEGIIRTYDESWRQKAHVLVHQIATSVCEGMGARCEVNIRSGYPVLVNDSALTSRAISAAEELLGNENIKEIDPLMTTEDFAFYSHIIPSCFYRLGIRNTDKGIISSVHTSTFDIDEQALHTGTALMAWLAISELALKSEP